MSKDEEDKKEGSLPSEVEDQQWVMRGLEKSAERLQEYVEINDAENPENFELEPGFHSDDVHPKVKKIDKRAVEDGYLSGKWEMDVSTDNVDSIWKKISKLISEYKIWGGQVTTDWVREKRDLEEHTIRVYTPNYLDKKDVMRVGNLLKEICDIEREIRYIPDIYNVLQIYCEEGNDMKLPEETRYTI